MTCLDALLGTDLAGLGKRIGREADISVVTAFMDPIVREGNYGPWSRCAKPSPIALRRLTPTPFYQSAGDLCPPGLFQ
jgi:hypothetical protein